MRLARVVFALTLVTFVVAGRPSAQPVGAGRFVEGEILVQFAPGANASARGDAHRQARGSVLDEIGDRGLQLVGVAAGDEAAAIGRYRQNPNVQYAEPNFIRNIPAAVSDTPGSEVVPGDFWFGEQWALHNTGQLFYCILPGFCFYIATADADVDGPEAWAISTGSPSVVVGVIDSGVDFTHPDLLPNYLSGIDYTGSGDPMDYHGHGTHVTATIAAALNNLTGNPAEEEGWSAWPPTPCFARTRSARWTAPAAMPPS